jgi:hypothetical protein
MRGGQLEGRMQVGASGEEAHVAVVRHGNVVKIERQLSSSATRKMDISREPGTDGRAE